MMRRRAIPYAAAGASVLVAGYLFFVAPVDETTANLATAAYLALVFYVKSGMHFWMRRRMKRRGRDLTVFGYALTDYFVGLVVLAAALALSLSAAAWYAGHGADVQPGIVRALSRVALVGAGTLVLGTAAATGYEMRRAGEPLAVHEGGDDRVLYQGPERRGGRDRRKGDRP